MIRYIPYFNILFLVILTFLYVGQHLTTFVLVVCSLLGFALALIYNVWIITRSRIYSIRFVNLIICNIELVIFVLALGLSIVSNILGYKYV